MLPLIYCPFSPCEYLSWYSPRTGLSHFKLELTLTTGLEDLPPVLVVMRIAPLAADAPYNAVAAPPFKTVIVSMILGSISMALFEVLPWVSAVLFAPWLKTSIPPGSLLSMGTPSITNKGWLSCNRDTFPLIVMREELPAIPLELDICTPETLPASPFTRLSCLAWITDSPFTSCVLYVSCLFSLLIPKAVTTTSDKDRVSFCN